jgi:sugar phosphate isomerase/epimerase
MKLGISTYTFMWSIGFEGARPPQPLTAIGLLNNARELGVKVVQVGPNLPLDKLSDAELVVYIQKAQEWNIELELGTRGLEPDHLTRQVALCKRLGATLLRTVPEIGGQNLPATDIPKYLRAIQPLLEKEGLKLAMENGKIPATDLRAALEKIDSPHFGIVLDMVNSLAVPEGWKEITNILAPYVMCLHFKDFVVERAWHMMGFICEGTPAGKGQLDAPWLFKTLEASRYDFNVIIELWPPEQKTLVETVALEHQWAVESVSFLRKYVKD